MDRMHGAWHNNLINVGLSVLDDGGIRRGKEFASEALSLCRRLAAIHSLPTTLLGQFDIR